ncbi:hypothetical protein HYALB_00011206 [Hymenoscyphus albidus]|uniref:DUF899-domain-containing protein n=1 Tax=Hymenoscyphus albidus TaxID=595503 RepID=A0A9N9Q157_9HELO|nr:hypothetical protein HYALB_00011206 [Hymenoscyphus albidus]
MTGKELLAKEKAALKAADELRAQIRDFPMVKLDKDYNFEGPDGQVFLSDLFNGRKQLIIYHFMLGPDDRFGCNGCSFVVDNLPSRLCHLNSRDTTLVLVSRAPLTKTEAFKERMGWNFPWYSSFSSDFNYDFQVTLDPRFSASKYNYNAAAPGTKGEQAGLSVFYKNEDDQIHHKYSTYERGLDHLLVNHSLLDLTPLGRQDGVHGTTSWRLHDLYDKDDAKVWGCLGGMAYKILCSAGEALG